MALVAGTWYVLVDGELCDGGAPEVEQLLFQTERCLAGAGGRKCRGGQPLRNFIFGAFLLRLGAPPFREHAVPRGVLLVISGLSISPSIN